MTTREIADAIYAHAVEHYNDGGWDVIVECWTVDMIEDRVLDFAFNYADALEFFASLADVWADREADAINSAF